MWKRAIAVVLAASLFAATAPSEAANRTRVDTIAPCTADAELIVGSSGPPYYCRPPWEPAPTG